MDQRQVCNGIHDCVDGSDEPILGNTSGLCSGRK